MRIGVRLGTLAVVIALLGVLAPAALAAPPPNDNRGNAQPVNSLPATLSGNTMEATREANEPEGDCADEGGSVWYRVPVQRDGRVIVGLNANGDLDAAVDVYRVQRSQLFNVNCDRTDAKGRAALDFAVKKGDVYLVRVAQLSNSVPDSFSLTLQLAQPDATPPGPALPAGGAGGSLDRVTNPSDAYSVRLRAGKSYRFNLSSRACTPLLLYAPGTRDFDERPVRRLNCGGYMLFTPDEGEGGRYTLLAVASGSKRKAQPYRLLAGRAGRDDTAPGVFIRNYARRKGSVSSGGLDVLDLYRFDVTKRSNLNLGVRSNSDIQVRLISAGGRRIASSFDTGEIVTQLRPGRYFAVVRAARGAGGKYTLTRVSRTITRTRTRLDGKRSETVAPGRTVSVQVAILPGTRGPVVVHEQRYDPVFGWQFVRTYHVRTSSNGTRTIAFHPPDVGRYRFRTDFNGTRGSSPSGSRYATLRVQGPLRQ
jgi:hypothetical protein